ncbi:OadG family protein [Brachyspira aalborgi]|jgi:oxaloacetate decarboxylase gamma subunit|uniref:Sodium pump decarboxylase n=1 Tax=Brachyspira aalborgi TaxID=29522 RepID=A0ABY3KBF7_9SPIR|nr:OadG family transporter subunit [Brachyspira aalborgi]TXJ34048.1 sodium pump decarboxylase [Brachyspira aalborgi]TXJ43651.1 sodium pump decarboxylase [Brachyspira aalborgi]CCY77452.1 oxaloacetate decarboxylase gamma chain [Brachyspira sp. CAG:700]
MNNEILAAIQIMFIGMGVVVLFLIILVYVMKFVSVVVAQINKIMPPQEEAISSAPVQSASGDKMKAVAIALAHIHSNKK